MKSEILAVGSVAPEIELAGLTGNVERLANYSGCNVLVIFYRGHWCPACRRQLGQLRDAYPSICRLGARVLAISTEPVEALRTSAHAQTLPFPLLSDTNGALVKSLGLAVFDEARDRWISRPATVLIDPAGKIQFAHIGEHARDRPALGAILLALEWMDATGR